MHLYLTNLRVETQAVGILLPQTYRRHWIRHPDIQIQTEMLAPDPRKLNKAGVMLWPCQRLLLQASCLVTTQARVSCGMRPLVKKINTWDGRMLCDCLGGMKERKGEPSSAVSCHKSQAMSRRTRGRQVQNKPRRHSVIAYPIKAGCSSLQGWMLELCMSSKALDCFK